jgi:hypothetical protein
LHPIRVVERATSSYQRLIDGPLNTTHPRPKLVGAKGEIGVHWLLTFGMTAVVPGMKVSPVMAAPFTHVSSVPVLPV